MAGHVGGGSEGGSNSMDKSITLPPDEIFRNLENAKRFAIDIGKYLQTDFFPVIAFEIAITCGAHD